MKCFMTLTDRFVRRGHDLAPLVDKGLITELTKRLASAGDTTQSTSSVTTIVNLLSTLCRGSSGAAQVSLFVSYVNVI